MEITNNKIPFTLIPLLLVSLFSHSGNVKQSGINKGCHTNRATKEMHCHPDRIRNSSISSKKISKVESVKYNRKLYPHWIDRDGDCQNERQELLIGRSLVPVIFKINKKGKSCTVKSGTWKDFYFNEMLTEASEVDVDHVIPLKYAHLAGAHLWSKDQRRVFANDPENLVLTNKKYNRSKGARSPLEWLPVNKEYACKYFSKWIFIKNKYKLEVTILELGEYTKMNCEQLTNGE